MTKELVFDALNGRRYKVRVVETGDKYGRDNCLTYEEASPMIEFYLTYEDREDYFISRYFVDTIKEIHYNQGLCLDGGQRDLDLSKFDLAFVKAWLFVVMG